MLGLKRPAVKQKSMANSSHAGNELVHNSSARADEFVLGSLAEQSEMSPIYFPFQKSENGEPD
jgi:hypothetical protein